MDAQGECWRSVPRSDDPPSDDLKDLEEIVRGCRPPEASETDWGVSTWWELGLWLEREGSYGALSPKSSDSSLVENTEGCPVDGSKSNIKPRVHSSSSGGIPRMDLSKGKDTLLGDLGVLELARFWRSEIAGGCWFEKGMA